MSGKYSWLSLFLLVLLNSCGPKSYFDQSEQPRSRESLISAADISEPGVTKEKTNIRIREFSSEDPEDNSISGEDGLPVGQDFSEPVMIMGAYLTQCQRIPGNNLSLNCQIIPEDSTKTSELSPDQEVIWSIFDTSERNISSQVLEGSNADGVKGTKTTTLKFLREPEQGWKVVSEIMGAAFDMNSSTDQEVDLIPPAAEEVVAENTLAPPSEPEIPGVSTCIRRQASSQITDTPLNTIGNFNYQDKFFLDFANTNAFVDELFMLSLSISHPYIGDLGVTLVSPSGTRIRIFIPAFYSFETFVQTAFPEVTATEDSMIPLYGQPIDGTWTLEIYDQDYDGGDHGTLNDWSLNGKDVLKSLCQ